MEHMVTRPSNNKAIPSNNKAIRNLLVTSRLQSGSRVAIYALAQSDHFNIGFPSRKALALPNPVSVGQRYVRVTDQGERRSSMPRCKSCASGTEFPPT
jgi:hypothetical protein